MYFAKKNPPFSSPAGEIEFRCFFEMAAYGVYSMRLRFDYGLRAISGLSFRVLCSALRCFSLDALDFHCHWKPKFNLTCCHLVWFVLFTIDKPAET